MWNVPIVWIEETTEEIINSGAVQDMENLASEAASQMMSDLGWVYGVIGGAWAWFLCGSRQQGDAYPTRITYTFPDGTTSTIDFSWGCSFLPPPDSGGYPPGV